MSRPASILISDLASQGGPIVAFLALRDSFRRAASQFHGAYSDSGETDVKLLNSHLLDLLCILRLDYQYLIDRRLELKSRIEWLRRQMRLARRKYGPSPDQEVVDFLKGLSVDSRKKERLARILCELEYARENDLGVIFNTLTFDDQALLRRDEFWANFRKRFQRYVLGGSGRKQCGQYCKLFGVPEYGSKTGRFHLHVVMVFDHVRGDFFDPNAGRYRPEHREIWRIKRMWQGGNSRPILVRWNNDRWARAGWRWPWKAGKPIASDPRFLGRYLSKYLTKQETYRTVDSWRVRPTRGFGLEKFDQMLETLTTEELWQILVVPNRSMIRIPGQMRLLKRRARRFILQRILRKICPDGLLGRVRAIPRLDRLLRKCALTVNLYRKLCDLKLEMLTLPTPSVIWKKRAFGTSLLPGAETVESEWNRKVELTPELFRKIYDFLLPFTQDGCSHPVERPVR